MNSFYSLLLIGILILDINCCGQSTASLIDLPLYKDISQPVNVRVADLLSGMTLDEKIGQMTFSGDFSISPEDVATYYIGGVLSGGDNPGDIFSPQEWSDHVKQYQDKALKTRLKIPLIYGVDAVHGHHHVVGATIFPHNIGLGATRDRELIRQIGQATAREMLATGIPWNFSPAVCVPQDIRWGRTYEGFSENTQVVSDLSSAYIRGMQTIPGDYSAAPGQTIFVGTTAKHFIGDGGTEFGSSTQFVIKQFLIDQGDMHFDLTTVLDLFMPPYKAAIDNNVMSVMISYNSWNGVKMHASKYWITEMLKGDEEKGSLGFQGFVVSDWEGIDQISKNYDSAVVTSINAGIDMIMVNDHKMFITSLKNAVMNHAVSYERIDDAVSRILHAKFELGLFDHPYGDLSLSVTIGSDAHRQLARQAVRESLVLLKNENNTLPIAKDASIILVAGLGSNDIGMQCGGWTTKWQGTIGDIYPGTTILEGIQKKVSTNTKVFYNQSGQFTSQSNSSSDSVIANVGIVVVGELPYAEGVGDRADLSLTASDIQIIDRMHRQCRKLVVIILSGRPLIITDQYKMADAWVVAWLPGTEGGGVADLLFGDFPFTGCLPFTWPRFYDQLPVNINNWDSISNTNIPLFPYGYRLKQVNNLPAQ